MAELFGRVDGCCGGRGGSMHMFDLQRRFMGGYGIVGRQPADRGRLRPRSRLPGGTEDVTLCQFGDGASNQGTFGETMNLAALWKLPVVFMVTNNQYGMGTSLERHSAVTDLQVKGEGFGVPGMECDGMDVARHLRGHARGAAHRARGAPAGPRRGHHLPLPRPLDGRPRGVPHEGAGRGVAQARPDRDLRRRGSWPRASSTRTSARRSTRRRSRASTRPCASPTPRRTPSPESLYDDIYVLGGQVRGWWSLDERTPTPHRGEDERGMAPADLERTSRRGGRAQHGGRHGSGGGETGRRGPDRGGRRRRPPTQPREARRPGTLHAATARPSTRRCARRCSATSASSSWARTSASSTAPSR